MTLPYKNSAWYDYILSVLVAIVLTGISYIVGGIFGWFDSLSLLEFAAVFTSYSCTFLCVKQRRFNYLIGAVSTALYCVLFWQNNLDASMALNLWLTFQLAYGWVRWRADEITRPVTHVTLKSVPLYILTTGLFYVGALGVVHLLGGQLAGWDTIILVASILAQFLLDNKKLETWLVWVVVNVVAIYVYFSSGLPLAGFQYVFFLMNTVYGYMSWYKSMSIAKIRKSTETWGNPGAGEFAVTASNVVLSETHTHRPISRNGPS